MQEKKRLKELEEKRLRLIEEEKKKEEEDRVVGLFIRQFFSNSLIFWTSYES